MMKDDDDHDDDDNDDDDDDNEDDDDDDNDNDDDDDNDDASALPGPNGDVSVKIIAGNERRHFLLESFSSSFNLLKINATLDREKINLYNLTFEVSLTDKLIPACNV